MYLFAFLLIVDFLGGWYSRVRACQSCWFNDQVCHHSFH